MLIKTESNELYNLEKFDRIVIHRQEVESEDLNLRGSRLRTGQFTYGVYAYIGSFRVDLTEQKDSEEEALQVLDRIFNHTSGNLDLMTPVKSKRISGAMSLDAGG